ncbi:hypothetical protein B0H10DRAFT_1960328 [Mycena sp. CBHHK59/15]|nr:hypothetical protein B0H10DRAFT_1960328 [Mycena sp. CBHHK59/15]
MSLTASSPSGSGSEGSSLRSRTRISTNPPLLGMIAEAMSASKGILVAISAIRAFLSGASRPHLPDFDFRLGDRRKVAMTSERFLLAVDFHAPNTSAYLKVSHSYYLKEAIKSELASGHAVKRRWTHCSMLVFGTVIDPAATVTCCKRVLDAFGHRNT